MTGRFAVAVVVEAADADAAERFLAETLAEEEPRDGSRPVPYIGAACRVNPAGSYSTEEIHLLCDGMRQVVTPERGA